MTKIDENARVPPVDAARRGTLAAALDRPGVVAALLFGSQAAGAAGPLSDVDVAVWLDPDLSGHPRTLLRDELTAAAIEALGTGELDLVVLNHAPPLLQHRVLRDGVRLLDRLPKTRVRLEADAVLRYLDTGWLRDTMAAARRRRLKEGSFGRR